MVIGGKVRKKLRVLLADTGHLHSEEQRIHEELQHFLFPGTLSVGITTQAAQQLSPCTETGHIVGTEGERKRQTERKSKMERVEHIMNLHKIYTLKKWKTEYHYLPVVFQIGEDIIHEAGDERHSFLLLITAIHHIQKRG